MKKILIGIVVLVVVFIAYMFMPTTLKVEESIIIKANKALVYDNVVKFENFAKWSPWSGLDPDQVNKLTGTDGEVGATMSWISKKEDVGEGSQKIVSKSPDRVDIKLKFTAPWESESNVYYLFKNVEEGIKVSWGFEQEANNMMGLMGIEKMLSEKYKEGLAALKVLIEN